MSLITFKVVKIKYYFIYMMIKSKNNIYLHSDNYIEANPISTPLSIVPEWYLLPFYAILRSISSKILGVIAIFGSLLILIALPLLDSSRIRGLTFRPIGKFLFWTFVADFGLLIYIGSQHVEQPFIVISQFATAFYFIWFLVLIPLAGIIENTLFDLGTQRHSK